MGPHEGPHDEKEDGAQNRAYEERFETYRSTLPVPWVIVALVVTLVGGFAAGLWWLDSLIRRRHGGFRIY